MYHTITTIYHILLHRLTFQGAVWEIRQQKMSGGINTFKLVGYVKMLIKLGSKVAGPGPFPNLVFFHLQDLICPTLHRDRRVHCHSFHHSHFLQSKLGKPPSRGSMSKGYAAVEVFPEGCWICSRRGTSGWSRQHRRVWSRGSRKGRLHNGWWSRLRWI